METKAKKIRWAVDQDGTWLYLLCENGRAARELAESSKGKSYRVTVKPWREKRSLSANAYLWLLLGKLSEVLNIPPEEIYRNLIPDVGGNSTVLLIDPRAVQKFRESWEGQGRGWPTELLGVHNGMVEVMAYYGSSTYDTAQMARLIDLIIDECKEAGVEYLPPDKLAAMLEDWDEKQTNKSPGNTESGERPGV